MCRLLQKGASLIAGLEYGMELTRVTGAAQPSVSLGLLSHRTSFMSKYGIFKTASISKHGTFASSSSGGLSL